MARDFNADAEEMKNIMEARNRRLKIIAGVLVIGAIGSTAVPIVVALC